MFLLFRSLLLGSRHSNQLPPRGPVKQAIPTYKTSGPGWEFGVRDPGIAEFFRAEPSMNAGARGRDFLKSKSFAGFRPPSPNSGPQALTPTLEAVNPTLQRLNAQGNLSSPKTLDPRFWPPRPGSLMHPDSNPGSPKPKTLKTLKP